MKPNGVKFFDSGGTSSGAPHQPGAVGGSAADISPIYRGNIGISAAPISDIFCIGAALCSLWSHQHVLTFSPLTGGCSEGLDCVQNFL